MKNETLLERRSRLLQELAGATQEEEATKQEYAPFLATFNAIDNQLRGWSAQRRAGAVFQESVWFKALDQRMEAGCVANPYKKIWKQAEGWYNRVMAELKIVNQEIAKMENPPKGRKDSNPAQRKLFLLD